VQYYAPSNRSISFVFVALSICLCVCPVSPCRNVFGLSGSSWLSAVSVFLSPCLSAALSLCISLSISVSLSLYLAVSLSLCLRLSVCLSLSLCLKLTNRGGAVVGFCVRASTLSGVRVRVHHTVGTVPGFRSDLRGIPPDSIDEGRESESGDGVHSGSARIISGDSETWRIRAPCSVLHGKDTQAPIPRDVRTGTHPACMLSWSGARACRGTWSRGLLRTLPPPLYTRACTNLHVEGRRWRPPQCCLGA